MTAASNEVALLPCPFCGGVPLLMGFNAPEFWVSCVRIGCKAGTEAFGSKDRAIAAWNTRAHSDPRPVAEGLPHGPAIDGLTLMQWSNRLYDFGQDMPVEARDRFKDKLGAFQDRLAKVLATHSPAPMAGEGQEAVSDAVHAELWKADAEVNRLRTALENAYRGLSGIFSILPFRTSRTLREKVVNTRELVRGALAAAPKVASDTGAITPEWCLRMADLEAGQEIGAGALDHPLRTKCELPPAGWICTRTPGHDGPCATVASDTGAGLREALAKEFRDASRGYGRAGTAEMRDGPYMSMDDAAGVYADLLLGKAASDVGDAFDLDGIKKLWRTGGETGRILQQADTSKAGFSEQAWAEAVRETDRHCYELDITNADHIVLWLEHQLNGHVGPLAYIACRILDAHEAALATDATDGATGGGEVGA